MEASTVSSVPFAAASKQFARRLLIIGANRLELLAVELQEEHTRRLQSFLLALGAAGCGLLACLALSAAIVVCFWAYSPVAALLTLSGLYGACGAALGWRLKRRLQGWQAFAASLDQLQKDRAGLENALR